MSFNVTHCPISKETPLEEHWNQLTHLLGCIASFVGASFLIYKAYESDNAWYLISCSIYALTLIATYLASTCYHGCQNYAIKQTLKIIDHSCIYLLIAGTYTPFALCPLRLCDGWSILLCEWGCAFVGVALKICRPTQNKLFSTIAYLLMGWFILFHWPKLSLLVSSNTLIWLLAGGVTYSIGCLFYLWKSLPFNHTIWHLFVLGGSFCHYRAVLSLSH